MSNNGVPDAGPARLLRLVQLCDSALPVGGYSHSWGLEAAIARGQVPGPVELEGWVRAWLEHSVAPSDGVIVPHAARAADARDWAELGALNDLVMASKVSPTLRRASLKQGGALLGLAAGWPWSGNLAGHIQAAGAGPWHHPVVFGALATAAGASVREALALYLQNAAGGVVAAAVRAVPIGHTHGQQLMARLHPLFDRLADQWANSSLERYGAFSPAYEVLGYAQSQLYTRIFQS